MLIIDQPVGFVSTEDAFLLAQCVDLAIRMTEELNGIPVRDDDPLRVQLAKLSRLAAFRAERSGIPDESPQGTMPTMSVKEFAARRGTTTRAITARCKRGTLPAIRVDGQWRIFTNQLDDQEVA